jgi:hypothetical protein
MKVYGPVNGITMDHNWYQAPFLQFGILGTVDVYIADTTLHSFREVMDNLWPVPYSISFKIDGGNFYLSNLIDNNNGYLTPAQWAAAFGGTDQYANLAPGMTYQVTWNAVTVGSDLPVITNTPPPGILILL